jgi:DNA repair photolyase
VRATFEEYQPARLVNVHRHVDGGWFWDKYTAHPYLGCRAGCEFCYERGGKWSGAREPDSFDQVIRVKTNAAQRLRQELARKPLEVIACGDWQQPAEARFGLSRKMLEVILHLGFPLVIIERSPFVARDLDLLVEIHRRASVSVLFSIGFLDPALKRAFEPRSPGIASRFKAMQAIASAGVPVGTALMPILPTVADDEEHLGAVIQATRDHGGSFIVAGGLTMEGHQAERTMAALRTIAPDHEQRWRALYGGEYAPGSSHRAELALRVRALCTRHGLPDRMPRPPLPGPLAVNKRIAERLFLETYDLELEQAPAWKIWRHRKAAWAVDELSKNLVDLHRALGLGGLEKLPDLGPLAAKIVPWLAAQPAPIPQPLPRPAGKG